MEEETKPMKEEEQIDPRQELFRYTDLSHPAMQVLFDLPVDTNNASEQ